MKSRHITESMSDIDKQGDLLRAKLNGETSRMQWTELQRFFAAGAVIAVRDGLDLVDVAMRVATDDRNAVAQWLADGSLAKVSDEQAQRWLDADAALWAVVVKPWVLVQQEKARKAPGETVH